MGGAPSKKVGGYRITRILEGGPADNTDLEIFFDSVVGIGEADLMTSDPSTGFAKIHEKVGESAGQPLKLVTYNSRSRRFKETYLIPARRDGNDFLGIALEYDMLENAMSEGIRVISVAPKSAGEQAGLVALKDYFIASNEGLLKTIKDLFDFVENHSGEIVTLLVYNSTTESIRRVSVDTRIKSKELTGLGCDVATGFINMIPYSESAHVGEVKFEMMHPIIKAELLEPVEEAPFLLDVSGEPQIESDGGNGVERLAENASSTYPDSGEKRFENQSEGFPDIEEGIPRPTNTFDITTDVAQGSEYEARIAGEPKEKCNNVEALFDDSRIVAVKMDNPSAFPVNITEDEKDMADTIEPSSGNQQCSEPNEKAVDEDGSNIISDEAAADCPVGKDPFEKTPFKTPASDLTATGSAHPRKKSHSSLPPPFIFDNNPGKSKEFIANTEDANSKRSNSHEKIRIPAVPPPPGRIYKVLQQPSN